MSGGEQKAEIANVSIYSLITKTKKLKIKNKKPVVMFAQSMTSSRERGDRRTGKSFQRKKRPLKGYEAISILLRVFFFNTEFNVMPAKTKEKKKKPRSNSLSTSN